MTERTFNRACVFLALTSWLLFALTSDGTLSVDPYTRWLVAESVFEDGDVVLPWGSRHTVEQDGDVYSVFFPGQSMFFLPGAALDTVLPRIFPISPRRAEIFVLFILSVFMISGCAPLCLLGHVAVLRGLGVRPKIALWSGMVLTIGTPLWVWSSNGSEEPALAALSIWAVWALLDADRIARTVRAGPGAVHADRAPAHFVNRLGVAALLLGFGLLHRSTFMTVILGLGVYAVPLMVRNAGLIARARGRFLGWVVLGAAVVSIIPMYNWLRFDSPLDTGYARYYEQIGGLFATPLLTGLRGHLLSPGKSVFLYAPWLILLPLALLSREVRRRLGMLTAALLVICVLHLFIYSRYTYWSGAFGWGVRFHVSLLPLLLVPIGVWLDRLRMTPVRRGFIVALGLFSFLVQVEGNTLSYGLEYRQHREHYTGYRNLIPVEAAWTWGGSQLYLRLVNIADKIRGEELLDIERDDPRHITTVWNVFPLRAGAKMNDGRIVAALWALWLGLLVLAGVAARCAWQQWKGLSRRSPSGLPPPERRSGPPPAAR